MIATEDHCFRNELQGLLEETLPDEQEQRVTSHLDHCSQCQAALQELVGGVELWQEATRVLASDSPTLNSYTPGSSVNQDHVAWVGELLQPCDDTNVMGLLDQRPVHEVVGHGGMGVVLKVWDAKLNRFLAAKMLSPMLASTGTARQRFFREAQSAAAVVHPNIVPIYDIVTTGKLPYILMPLVGGGSLQQRIEEQGSLPLVEVLGIGLQLADALTAAHAQGLVHRDIKPANILLDSGGRRVLLSDFGLARTLDDASMTASGLISGTPHYMSPEQARGSTLDGRSDLYGLGAILYAMATGHPPVRGTSPLEVLRRVTDEPVTHPSQVNETLPAWFDTLLQQFLCKDRDRRITSATQAGELLRACLAHVRTPAQARLPAVVQTGRNRRRVAILVSAGLLTLITIGHWTSGILQFTPDKPVQSEKRMGMPSELSVNSDAAKMAETTGRSKPTLQPYTQTEIGESNRLPNELLSNPEYRPFTSADTTSTSLDFSGQELDRQLQDLQSQLDSLQGDLNSQ